MNPKVLLSILLSTLGFSSLHAQQRSCELAVTLLSPSEGLQIPAYAQYLVTVRIVNNGPNDLLLGDTLYYNTPSMPAFTYNTYVLTQPIVSGNSADVTVQTTANINTNTQDITDNYAVSVVSRPDTLGSWRDFNWSNNQDVNSVTFKPCDPDGSGGGTAVSNVNAKDLNINIYPNPTSDFIHLKSEIAKMNSVFVNDISGRVVLQKDLSASANSEIKINIASLPSGMYLLKIATDKGTATSKFIKQ
jgi:hypothetical protein